MRRTLTICALLVTLAWASGVYAQQTLFSGNLPTVRSGSGSRLGNLFNKVDSTVFHVRTTTVGDTSISVSTSGWKSIAIQHLFSGATQNYAVVPYWSNDASTWTTFGDSLTARSVGTAYYDTLHVREFAYFRLILTVGGSSPTSATLSTGTINLCAKGVK